MQMSMCAAPFCFTLMVCLIRQETGMKKIFLLLALPLMLAACQAPTAPTHETSTVVDTHHTAENSLDWAGSYTGLLPCADCEGIQTQLTLRSDKTYVLEEHYVKNGRALHPSTQTGRFQFDASHPALIRLDNTTPQRVYFIGEGYAEARDAQGNKISSQLNYRLQQQP